MNQQPITRRDFLQDTAAAAAATAAISAMTRQASAAAASDFASQWHKSHDRVWLGQEYWANPLQDWRVAGGRIECVTPAVNRNVHLLTRQLSEQPGDLRMSVRIGRVEGGPLSGGRGSAGFRIGIMGPLREYRNSLIFGQGLDVGFSSDGRLFMGNPASGVPVDLAAENIELRVAIEPRGEQSVVALSAHAANGTELGRVSRENVATASVAGNLALVANFGSGTPPSDSKAGEKGAKKGKKKAADSAPGGQFWFADWKLSGSRLEAHDDRAFGPILFSQYTLTRGEIKGIELLPPEQRRDYNPATYCWFKLTVQMPPLGPRDNQHVQLELLGLPATVRLEETIDPHSRTATFKMGRHGTNEAAYRIRYVMKQADGSATEHFWTGMIRRDPVDQPVLTVADVSCNIHEAFPNADYTAKMARLNPDLLAFVGDQFYESSGGYGVQRAPLEPAILDYLRKWYMHGWTWRELTRDRPSISIPDDHDVYQGNNWGEGGAPQTGTQEQGGYNMPAAWVNVVHKTQTSHHPDPWDPTPGKQGITVYSGPLVYGGVSFAILADRQFKSAPEGKVPPTGGRGDHVTDPNFDPKMADVPGLQLLGSGQMKHLREWVRDWRGAEMKAVISQTIFTAMATTHGGPGQRLVADYDTNGWPQSERNAALREIRRAFAVHIAGDQHLPAAVHYGIDEQRDAGIAFAGPAVNTGYPRWFEPLKPGENRAPGAPEITGEFRDSFGHPLTVLAVVNGSKQPRQPVLEKLHDKASGLGLVRFDKKNRKITIECWPLLADPLQPGTQFPGWPVTFDMLTNYGRKIAAHLPRIMVRGADKPVLEVIDEKTGELVYGLRLASNSWQPHVFALGSYTVRLSVPESGKTKELRGLEAKMNNNSLVELIL
jgi:phosphodiesterase/alkaline phosphatase D-like protein